MLRPLGSVPIRRGVKAQIRENFNGELKLCPPKNREFQIQSLTEQARCIFRCKASTMVLRKSSGAGWRGKIFNRAPFFKLKSGGISDEAYSWKTQGTRSSFGFARRDCCGGDGSARPPQNRDPQRQKPP